MIPETFTNESVTDPGLGYWRAVLYFNTWWMNEHAPNRTFLMVLDFSDVPGWIAGARPVLLPSGAVRERGDQVGPLAAYLDFAGEDDLDEPHANIALARDYPLQPNWSTPEYPSCVVTQDWPWPSTDSPVKIIPYTYTNPPKRGAHLYSPVTLYSDTQGLIPLLRAHVLFPQATGAPPPWPYDDPWVAAGPGPSGVIRAR
jgi:hypothetical protein